jgi:hypothetical protein
MQSIRTRTSRLRVALALAATMAIAAAAPAFAHDPTCADFEALGIVVHGQHVVRDYVTGGQLEGWPPAGGVGQAIAGEGAAVPGGPGPGFHFPNGFAPGASFCLSQSEAPGFHVPG